LTKVKYDFYSDGGHGWLKVAIIELEKLQIHDQISSASYMRTGYAYLEEDCDASLFVDAKQNTGERVNGKNHTPSDSSSKIRNYETYDYYDYIKKIEWNKIDSQVNDLPSGKELDHVLDDYRNTVEQKTRILFREEDLI